MEDLVFHFIPFQRYDEQGRCSMCGMRVVTRVVKTPTRFGGWDVRVETEPGHKVVGIYDMWALIDNSCQGLPANVDLLKTAKNLYDALQLMVTLYGTDAIDSDTAKADLLLLLKKGAP